MCCSLICLPVSIKYPPLAPCKLLINRHMLNNCTIIDHATNSSPNNPNISFAKITNTSTIGVESIVTDLTKNFNNFCTPAIFFDQYCSLSIGAKILCISSPGISTSDESQIATEYIHTWSVSVNHHSMRISVYEIIRAPRPVTNIGKLLLSKSYSCITFMFFIYPLCLRIIRLQSNQIRILAMYDQTGINSHSKLNR